MKKDFIVFAIMIVLVIFLLFATIEPPEPKDLVNNRTVLNYSNLFFNYRIIRYPTSVEVVPIEKENVNIGFVTDPWNLKFGIAPANGSYIKRFINIKNLEEDYSKIKLNAYGSIAPLVNFSKNDFALNENESIAIEVTLYTDSVEIGNYSGEIDVMIKTPKNDLFKILA